LISHLPCYDLMYDSQLKGWGDSDYILETGEKFEVTVDLRGLRLDLHPYETITLTIKPPVGAVMQVQRTLPSDITQVICLY
jgi:archaellin